MNPNSQTDMNSPQPPSIHKTNVFHFRAPSKDTGIKMRPAGRDWSDITPLSIVKPREKSAPKDVILWVLC